MNKLFLIPVLLFSISCAHADVSQKEISPLQTVSHVDLQRYAGKWFEIAKYPNRFQRGCTEAVAEYLPLQNGTIEVHNTCKKTKDGQLKDIIGVATVKDTESNAKLSVNFLPSWLRWTGIGAGKYWIIDLEPNYQYVVVSEPKREYLWILSRTPTLDRVTYESILQKITAQQLSVKGLEFSRENPISN